MIASIKGIVTFCFNVIFHIPTSIGAIDRISENLCSHKLLKTEFFGNSLDEPTCD